MKLSVREVASVLDVSPRAVRAKLARGELAGKKQGGRWRVERGQLPLTETQRRRLQAQADQVRRVVEEALPSRMARSRGDRSRSVADIDAFRRGAEVLQEMRGPEQDALTETTRESAIAFLQEALLAFAEGVQLFDRTMKLEALNRARAHLARVAALLLLEGAIPPAEPVFSWVRAIEGEVIPAVAGFARWTDRQRERRR